MSLLVLAPALAGGGLGLAGFVVVYGLDWVATVPPTVALCRQVFGADATIVFGWVFASHQLGAAGAAVAAVVSVRIRRPRPRHPRTAQREDLFPLTGRKSSS